MAILISNEILTKICEELSKSTESFTMISAYCKLPLVEYFDTRIRKNGLSKNLIVRMRPDDILSGATDLELYPYCKAHGWYLYFRLDLHAKTYIFDNLRCIVGSANATSSGLSIGGVGNYEMASVNEIDANDRQTVNHLFKSSVCITDSIYEAMKKCIDDACASGSKPDRVGWPNSIMDLFRPDFSLMFSEDFPPCSDPSKAGAEDLLFLNTISVADGVEIKRAFMASKCYQWLLNLLKHQEKQELFFGAATDALHNVILNDPKPYRKDVKLLLANLLSWIMYLECEDIIIDRPHYSQRISLKNR